MDGVRWDRVREARRKAVSGEYDKPEVVRETVARVHHALTVDEIRRAAGCATCQDDPEQNER